MDDIFPTVKLNIPLQNDFLPLLLSYIEKSASAFNFPDPEIQSLMLATEEVFSFLVFNAKSSDNLLFVLKNKGSSLELVVKFAPQTLPVKALNITAKVIGKNKLPLNDMGILIAARSVDNLSLKIDDDNKMIMTMIKKKSYHNIIIPKKYDISYGNSFYPIDIDLEKSQEFLSLIHDKYKESQIPDFLSMPDKFSDMINQGEFDGCFAQDENNNLAGALLWRLSGKMIFGFGFYTFCKPEIVAKVLWKGCISRTAMINPYCCFIRNPTKNTPEEYFQKIDNAAYAFMANDQENIPVFLAPPLVPFVQNFYQKLSISRQIYEKVINDKEFHNLSDDSAFAADMDRKNKKVTLSLIWLGKDALKNLKEQAETLLNEGFEKIYFKLQIENSPHAIMGEFLLKAGFKPNLIIPWTEQGDLLYFLYNP